MKHKTDDELGLVIKSARLKIGLTREKLAEMVDLSPCYIMAIENEGKKPSFDKTYTLIRTLGIKADDIFYPENRDPGISIQRLTYLLLQCDERDVRAITALVETLLAFKQ